MKLKALCIVMIAILIVGQIPTNYVLADEVDANATGGGNSNSLVSGNGTLNWNQTKSGYRFTLIDRSGNVVSIGNNGKPGSVDVFFCDYNKIDTPFYYTSAKTQPLGTENNGIVNKRLSINELNKAADLSSLPPFPISSNGVGSAIGNGKDLKLWLMESQKWIGKYPKSTSTNTSSTTSTTTSSKSTDTTTKNTIVFNLEKEQEKIIASAKELHFNLNVNKASLGNDASRNLIYQWMERLIVKYQDLNNQGLISNSDYNKIILGTSLDCMAYMLSATFNYMMISKLPNDSTPSEVEVRVSFNINNYISNIEELTTFDDKGRKRLMEYYVEGELNFYGYLYNEGFLSKSIYNYAKTSLNKLADKYKKTLKLSSVSNGIENVSYVKDSDDMIYTFSMSFTNPVYLSASSSNSNEESEEEGEIYKILRARYNKKPLFELPEHSKEEYKGMDTVEIMIAKGYLLMVENLTLIQPATWDSATQSAGKRFQYEIFGTITNYAEVLNLMKEEGLWSDMSGGSYSTPTTKLGWSALMTESDWKGDGITIKAPNEQEGTRRPMDELAGATNLSKGIIEGYGLQLYMTLPQAARDEVKEDLIRQINIIVSKENGKEKIIDVDAVKPDLLQNPLSTGITFRSNLKDPYRGGSRLIDWKIVNGIGIPFDKSLDYYRNTLTGKYGKGSPATPIRYGETAVVFYEIQKPDVQLITVVKNIKKQNGSVVDENTKVSKPNSITEDIYYDEESESYVYQFTGLPPKAKNLKSKIVDGLNLTGSDYDSFGKGKTVNSAIITDIPYEDTTVLIYYELISNTNVGGGKSTGDITLEEDEIAKGITKVIASTDPTYKLTATFDGYPKDSVGCGQNYILTSNSTYSIKYMCNVEDENTGRLTGLDKDIIYTGNGSPFVGKRSDGSQFKSGSVKATNNEQTKTYKPDYDITVYRGKYVDKITLADYYYSKNGKDNTYKQLTNILGFKAANKITSPRAEVNGWFSSPYKLASMVFSVTGDLDAVYYGVSKCTGHTRWIDEVKDKDGKVITPGYSETYTRDHGSIPNTTINAVSSSETTELDVAINNYMGTENSGDNNSSDKQISESFKVGSITFTNNSLSKAYGYSINNDKAMGFNPYIRMKYSTASNPNDWSYVYVLSEHRSEIKNSDYVDIGFTKSAENSLIVDSSQWSTHKRAIDALGKNNVLPAGAVFNLKVDPSNKTYVGMQVWQTFVESDQSNVVSNYSYYSESAAQGRRDILVKDVKSTIQSYDVVQYIAEGILKSTSDIESKGVMLDISGTYGTALKKVFGNKINTNSKYYIKTGRNTTASSGKIDIVNENVNSIIWKMASDVNGNITIYKNGKAYKSISKSQGINDIIGSDEDLQTLNDKTKLISNFLTSIDRNAGNGNWYNEAMDGISVIVTSYLYEVGFKTGSTIRSAALDTALAGKLDSKSDMYNFNTATAKDKVRTSFFKTSPRASLSGYKGFGSGYIASWGDENINIYLEGIDDMLSSRIFYLSNITVSDLD
ncbi:MAG: hypothetical protein K0S47_2409 [Herbinix sp.]|jgi:hypothetical protein|nr:hypothetical protein [Herbinix sp.]